MARLELIKVIARAVIAERDDSDRIIGERETDAVPLYTAEQLVEYYGSLHQHVEETNQELAANATAAALVEAIAEPENGGPPARVGERQ